MLEIFEKPYPSLTHTHTHTASCYRANRVIDFNFWPSLGFRPSLPEDTSDCKMCQHWRATRLARSSSVPFQFNGVGGRGGCLQLETFTAGLW